jgi:aspartyl-tRNA(Asn)/glutamyl-tRNA(Gln) amidotransferase subunit A
VVVGKTNMDEFGMGSSTENSAFGPTRNPRDRSRVPGGSSGGSAAAVAAGLVPAALGSDTGGSVRQPAALCGVVGLKPTYGRVSRYGLVAFGSSLDQIGVFARGVRDAARVLEAISGGDRRDATCRDRPPPRAAAVDEVELAGKTIGVPEEYMGEGLDDGVRQRVEEAAALMADAGAEVRDVSVPAPSEAVSCYYVIAPAEASSNLARFDGVRYGNREEGDGSLDGMYRATRGRGFGPEVKRRIMLGTFALSAGYYDAYYRKAQQMRRLIKNDFMAAFEDVDLVLGPTSPTPAFNIGERADDPVKMYLSDLYTIAVNLAGLPAISLPAGFAGGRPVGLQLIGNYFDEGRLLNAAHRYQQVTDWHNRAPGAFA